MGRKGHKDRKGRRVIVDRQDRMGSPARWDRPAKMAYPEYRAKKVTEVRRVIEVSPACEASWDHRVSKVAQDHPVRGASEAREVAQVREDYRAYKGCKAYIVSMGSLDDPVASA